MRPPMTFAGPLLGIAAVTLLGCATSSTPAARTPAPALAPLVVGVSSEAPPYAVRHGEELRGLEVEFARALAAELRRPLTLVDLRFGELRPALASGRIHVIMAGMTVTRARELRLAFAEPYLQSGLVAVMRRGEVSRYDSVATVLRRNVAVGVVDGTTGDMFVRERMQASQVIVYPTAAAAMDELRQNRVDLVVTDAPVAAWFVSANEADLGLLPQRLNEEPLAWAMARDDDALRASANAALARWRTDGTLDRILDRWVPFWRRLAAR